MSGKQINSYGKFSAEVTNTQLRQSGNSNDDLDCRIQQLEDNGISWSVQDDVLAVDTDEIYKALDARRGVSDRS